MSEKHIGEEVSIGQSDGWSYEAARNLRQEAEGLTAKNNSLSRWYNKLLLGGVAFCGAGVAINLATGANDVGEIIGNVLAWGGGTAALAGLFAGMDDENTAASMRSESRRVERGGF